MKDKSLKKTDSVLKQDGENGVVSHIIMIISKLYS